MALFSSPYGFKPISDQSGFAPRPVRLPYNPGVSGGIASGQVGNIFKYQPVAINTATGTIVPVTNPGGVPQKIYGIFSGVEYTPLGGRPAVSPYWPSGTVYDPTLDMLVYIWPFWLPSLRFKVQADGSVPQALLGSQFNITNPVAGVINGGVGLSQATVGAAGVGAGAQGQFALTEFATDVAVAGQGQSLPGDAFTDLIMTIALPQVGLGIQASAG